MRFGRRVLASLCLVACLTTACTDNTEPDGQGDGASGSATSTGQPDPQVFQDVVDSVLMIPGETQRRAIRLSNFTRNLIFQACGMKGIPLDDTSGRFMQQLFPDLELIRSRGLTEQDPLLNEPRAPGDPSECDIRSSGVEKKLPSRTDAMDLIQPWLDLAGTMQQDPTLTSLKQPMWECMTSRTSLDVGQDVPIDFLQATNISLSDDEGDDKSDLQEWSVVYADCAAPYFDRLREMLLEERPSVVERNRELLQRYAAELVAAGYVP